MTRPVHFRKLRMSKQVHIAEEPYEYKIGATYVRITFPDKQSFAFTKSQIMATVHNMTPEEFLISSYSKTLRIGPATIKKFIEKMLDA